MKFQIFKNKLLECGFYSDVNQQEKYEDIPLVVWWCYVAYISAHSYKRKTNLTLLKSNCAICNIYI